MIYVHRDAVDSEIVLLSKKELLKADGYNPWYYPGRYYNDDGTVSFVNTDVVSINYIQFRALTDLSIDPGQRIKIDLRRLFEE